MFTAEVIAVGLLLWLGLALWLGLLLGPVLRDTSYRLNGSEKPPASDRTKAGGQPTPATGTTVLTSSSFQRGHPSEGAGSPRPLLLPSRITVLTSSGSATVTLGGNGAPEGSADSDD